VRGLDKPSPRGRYFALNQHFGEMKMKATYLKAAAACALLLLGTTQLDAKASNVAAGIAVGVAAGAVIAAAASAANADFDADTYDYAWGYNPGQNAVAACMHKAAKRAQKKGAYRIVAERSDYLDPRGPGVFKVGLRLKAVYPRGVDVHFPKCTVQNGWVSGFKMN
jgi:hypothetical protein